MSILDKAISGRKGRAQKVVIYGPEGFGKSTLASLFPNPLFLDVEDSTAQMDVLRLGRDALPDLRTFESALGEVAKGRACGSLIVDTVDWLEQMALDSIIAEANSPKIQGIEDFGYGKGYTILRERMTILLAKIDTVIAAGVTVVLLAHSKVNKFEPPDGAGPYDRYELKLSKQVAPLLKEWADMLLFGNWRVQVREKDKDEPGAQFKAVGGRERLMHCNRTAAWDAKNRHGMADVEKWDIGVIEKAFRSVGAPWGEAQPAAPKAETAKPAAVELPKAETPKPEPAPIGQPGPLPEEPDGIPGVENPPDAELARIFAGNETAITEYLREKGKITPKQDWRSCPVDYADRIKKNPAKFLKVALNGKAVTA